MKKIHYFIKNFTPKQIFLKNIFFLSTAQIISKSLKLLLIIPAAHILGPQQYGVFSYTLYIVSFFFVFSDLGISPYFIREYQKKIIDRNKLVSATLLLKIFLLLLIITVAFFFYFLLKDSYVIAIYFTMVLFVAIGTIRDYLLCFIRAENQMEHEALVSIIDASITTIVGIFFLFTQGTLFAFTLAYVIGSLSSMLYLLIIRNRFPFKHVSFDVSTARSILFFSIPFVFGGIMTTLLYQADIIILKLLRGSESAGFYAIGIKSIQILAIIPILIVNVLYPILSGLTDDYQKISNIMKKISSLLLFTSLPVSCIGYLYADVIIVKIFGNSYIHSIEPFQILLLALPLLFFVPVFDSLLLVLNYQFQNMVLTGLAALLNIILNIVLIHFIGIAGSALATLISQLINFILTYYLLKSIIRKNLFIIIDNIKIGLASLLTATALFLVKDILSPFIFVLLSMVLYLGITYIMRVSIILDIQILLKKIMVQEKTPYEIIPHA